VRDPSEYTCTACESTVHKDAVERCVRCGAEYCPDCAREELTHFGEDDFGYCDHCYVREVRDRRRDW